MTDTHTSTTPSIQETVQAIREAEDSGKLLSHPASSASSASGDEVKMSWGSAMRR